MRKTISLILSLILCIGLVSACAEAGFPAGVWYLTQESYDGQELQIVDYTGIVLTLNEDCIGSRCGCMLAAKRPQRCAAMLER